MTIVFRYILKEMAKTFCLLLGTLYFLYVLIDYSAHAKVFQQEGIIWKDCFLYYMDQWTKRCDLLIPVALLVTLVKVLATLNVRNELVALRASGMQIKRLLRAVFLFTACCMGFLYVNFQWIQPRTLTHLHEFEDRFFKESHRTPHVHHVSLEDGSSLIYRTYHSKNNTFTDAYWVKSPDEITHFDTLKRIEKGYLGQGIDHIRHIGGDLPLQLTRLDEQPFPQMVLETNPPPPPEWQSLTDLARHLPWKRLYTTMSDREAEVASLLIYKTLIPLTCLLIVFAATPLCLKFCRHLPIFLIFAATLFGLIAFFTTVNAALILSKHQVFPPLLSLLLPFLCTFAIFGWRYGKL